ncbi:MAG: hypothetical protein WCH40_03580 [Verrucomicrobiales bacterium]
MSAALGSGGYFYKPHSSWEKVGVENFNGLVASPAASNYSLGEKIRPELSLMDHHLLQSRTEK